VLVTPVIFIGTRDAGMKEHSRKNAQKSGAGIFIGTPLKSPKKRTRNRANNRKRGIYCRPSSAVLGHRLREWLEKGKKKRKSILSVLSLFLSSSLSLALFSRFKEEGQSTRRRAPLGHYAGIIKCGRAFAATTEVPLSLTRRPRISLSIRRAWTTRDFRTRVRARVTVRRPCVSARGELAAVLALSLSDVTNAAFNAAISR